MILLTLLAVACCLGSNINTGIGRLQTTAVAIAIVKAAPQTNKCMILENSSACPNQNGQVIAMTSAYADTPSFDKFVASRLDSNSEYIDAFKSNFGCSQYNGVGQRFHISLFCALLAQKPIGCTIDDIKPRIPLCKDTCEGASKSLSDLYGTTSICEADAQADLVLERNKTIQVYKEFCSSLTIQNPDGGQCYNSSTQPQEVNTCGYGSVTEGKDFCSKPENSQLSCCVAIAGADASAVASDNVPNPNNSESKEIRIGAVSRTVFIILIVIGGVLILIILFLVYRFLRERQRNGDNELATIQEDIINANEKAAYNTNSYIMGLPSMFPSLGSPAIQEAKLDSSLPRVPPEVPISKDKVTHSEMKEEKRQSATLDVPIMQVIAPYNSKMEDELALNVGDKIRLSESYDDGWAFGSKVGTDESGSFPLVCTVIETAEPIVAPAF